MKEEGRNKIMEVRFHMRFWLSPVSCGEGSRWFFYTAVFTVFNIYTVSHIFCLYISSFVSFISTPTLKKLHSC